MKIHLTSILPKRSGMAGPAGSLLEQYLGRCEHYLPTSHRVFSDETKLISFLSDSSTRTRPYFLIADSAGQQISSPELAALFTQLLDGGTQNLVLAIGPADGWSALARQRADKMIAFGRITLPHELAAVVAAEQIYRALTIRAGHPYHGGH
jgi:23S rRNA (pseudouridine1915-N3)-methyltransferase